MTIRLLTRASNVLIPVAAVAFALGCWQLQRMDDKKSLETSFNEAQYQDLDSALTNPGPFSRVEASGQFDDTRHILLDNKVYRGKAGVHVHTPFVTESGVTILVNRGWKPMTPDRSRLPTIETPGSTIEIRGILAPPPENRQTLGAPDVLTQDDWPQLVTYLQLETVAEALEIRLPDHVIWLNADHPAGFDDRNWKPGNMTPQQHQAYAVQWFAMGLAALGFWAFLLWRDIKSK